MSAITLAGVVEGEEKFKMIESGCLFVRDILDFLKDIYPPKTSPSVIELRLNYRRINLILVKEPYEDLDQYTLSEMFRLRKKENVPFDRMRTFGHYLQYVHICHRGVGYDNIRFAFPSKNL